MDFSALYKALENGRLGLYLDSLKHSIDSVCERGHGDEAKWKSAIQSLPVITKPTIQLDADRITIGNAADIDDASRQLLETSLQQLHPWRKGPYELFGVHIDTEWRSDFKWQRLASHIKPLKHCWVLDVGCGNGYHALRALGAGAERVIGIDPSLLFAYQFQAIKKFIPDYAVDVLPLSLEQFPQHTAAFDTVFSMGVLYHRRSPLDHLQSLYQCLRPGGELVLETLVVEGDEQHCLLPRDRYARMRNVWFLPSVDMLILWLQRLGFSNARVVDVNLTSTEEQRETEWMRFESLSQCLNPDDTTLTVEGYPAPRRAIIIASREK
ncbi:MAG: tRNA 5-methoxyuridine(34)/uridine 5-oxyacetic acid(34) synthase CmoB [Proteobacteria bacterium]|nr:tRNA 5-methoxyuridine(34)/uridine 5-oxyacetic acid(34) synthase CmoB [Pseudomonadota bacterium]